MTKPARQIEMIFGSLESAGFPRSLQEILLPEWVTPEALSDATVSSEIATIIAKRLGLRASSLFAENPQIESLRRHDIKYKRSIPSKSKNLTAASSIAVSVAESIASVCRTEFHPFVDNPAILRQEVLSLPGKWLGLRNLLMVCWSHGIPVVHLAEIGQGVPKMDGTVVHTASRPVILLSKASPLWAWQLFIIAHEVAHVALRHISPNQILVDENLSQGFYHDGDNDLDERAADAFAIYLLNGRSDATYSLQDNEINPNELAAIAYEYGRANFIDPGHIALNFGYNSGKWDTAMSAAQQLQGDQMPAPMIINKAMWSNIDHEYLPSDTIEFLGRVTGLQVSEVDGGAANSNR